MNAGMKRGRCVELLGLTRHQLYYKSNGRRVGAQKTMDTLKLIDEDKNFENKFLVSKNKIPNDKDKGFDINQTDI